MAVVSIDRRNTAIFDVKKMKRWNELQALGLFHEWAEGGEMELLANWRVLALLCGSSYGVLWLKKIPQNGA